MKKVIVLALSILLVTGLVQAQDSTSEINVELKITDFHTVNAGMNIIFYDVVADGEVIDSYWERWHAPNSEDEIQIELKITDFRTVNADMNIIFYDVVADGEVIDSYWSRWQG